MKLKQPLIALALGLVLGGGGIVGYRLLFAGDSPTMHESLESAASHDSVGVSDGAIALADSIHEPAGDTLGVGDLPLVAAAGEETHAQGIDAPAVASELPSAATLPVGASAHLEPARLARLFGAMQAREAARVLERMTDAEIQSVLSHLADRQAAGILSNLSTERAAQLTQAVLGRERSPQ